MICCIDVHRIRTSNGIQTIDVIPVKTLVFPDDYGSTNEDINNLGHDIVALIDEFDGCELELRIHARMNPDHQRNHVGQ